jgi:hypothetical protein
LSRDRGSVTNNNGFWIGWLDLLIPYTINSYSAITDLHNLQFNVTHALGFLVFTSRIPVTELSLHRLASNSSSTTNFPWLSPTDNSHSRTPTNWSPGIPRYIASGRTSRKTRVTCQNPCSLARYPAVGMAQVTQKTPFILVAYYCTRYTATGCLPRMSPRERFYQAVA